MDGPGSHHIAEQQTAYRRGLVLGLTMAEVGLLIIFVLLLVIALDQWRRSRAMQGRTMVKMERLRVLEQSDALVAELRQALSLSDDARAEEIRTLVRTLRETAAIPEGQTALQEVRAALVEMRRIREQITKDGGGAEALGTQVERQSYRIANQEGQLRRYEAKLLQEGLGKGERPCWVNPNGEIEYLYDVVLTSSGIRMREYRYPQRGSERSLLPMPESDPSEILSAGQFLERTQALYDHSLAANCRFFVVIYDSTGPTEKELYKQLLLTVEGHFYKRLDRGTAPF